MNKTRQSGFTLIEIAIVLVIIGLLLGGILKGSEMITQGKIKSAINDFDGITAAYYSYIDRYHALPGDDQNAATRWPVATYVGMTNGSGNGIIAGTFITAVAGTESRQFWQQLRASGLINGLSSGPTAEQQPLNFNGGTIGVQTGDGLTPPGQVLLTAGAIGSGFGGLILCSANLPDKVAISIDSQLDDGSSNSGNVRANTVNTAGAPGTGGSAAPNYVENNGSNTYTLCKLL